MAHAYCEFVKDGNTFRAKGQIWIRLANVSTPGLEEPGGLEAKQTLENRILNQYIIYNPVGKNNTHIVADVWVENKWVNEYMRLQGYTC